MYSRSNHAESPEAARHAKLGTLVEHSVKNGTSTELKVFTGPAHKRRNVVCSYYLQSVKNAGIAVETHSNGVVITIDAVVPIREVIAKVNNRSHGKLRVAVFLKVDRQGNPYFEVHTPKGSYTDIARATLDMQRDPMRPVCPDCGSQEDLDAAELSDIDQLFSLVGLSGLDGSRRRRMSLDEILRMASRLRPGFNPFGEDTELENEAEHHEAATAAASNGNGHAASRNGNGRAASSNGNGAPKSRKKSRGKKKNRGANRRSTMKASRSRQRQVVTE